MERKITPEDIRKSANEAFEKAKAMNEGNPDARLEGVDAEKFGLSITLVDGTTINIGDTDTRAAIGGIARIPALLALMQQTDNPVEAAEKSDVGAGCGCKRDHSIKPHIPVGAYSVRIVSAVEPNGDPDSKWNEIINGMISAMGSTPVLDDALYKKLTKINIDSNAEDVLADTGFYLYDDAASSIDLYTRLTSMCASASQLSAYGATIAAGGYSPTAKTQVFDSSIAPRIVASMAAKGPHRASYLWLVGTGLPARSSFSGMIMGVLPGVLSIAAYSPRVNDSGISVRGAAAIEHFMNSLHLSAFSGEHIII